MFVKSWELSTERSPAIWRARGKHGPGNGVALSVCPWHHKPDGWRNRRRKETQHTLPSGRERATLLQPLPSSYQLALCRGGGAGWGLPGHAAPLQGLPPHSHSVSCCHVSFAGPVGLSLLALMVNLPPFSENIEGENEFEVVWGKSYRCQLF